jgi:hypothetical protein
VKVLENGIIELTPAEVADRMIESGRRFVLVHEAFVHLIEGVAADELYGLAHDQRVRLVRIDLRGHGCAIKANEFMWSPTLPSTVRTAHVVPF